MEQSLLIFLMASAASFYPIYRVLSRILLVRRKPSAGTTRRRCSASPREQFLLSLQLEAAARIRSVAEEAVARSIGPDSTAPSESLDASWGTRLDETALLARALLAPEVAATFEELARAVRDTKPFEPDRLDALVCRLQQHLDEATRGPHPRPGTAREAVWWPARGATPVAPVMAAGNPA